EITINNLPLGSIKNIEYEVIEEKIQSGDTLLMMSDGFPELNNSDGDMIGYPKVKSLFGEVAEKNPEEIITHLNAFGNKWTSGKENKDDVTFVVLKVI